MSAHVALAIADNPSTEDRLGYQPYVEAMAQMINSEALETPFTIGVYGPWGSGKSTFMYLLKEKLRPALDLQPITFRPWQFEQREDVWKALVYTVLSHLERKLPGTQRYADAEKTLRELLLGVGRLALDKALKATVGDSVELEASLGRYAKMFRENTDFMNTFRRRFEKLRDEIIGSPIGSPARRLVIFVDDLDRCAPDNCLSVLEAIKLFFDLPGCVFVLGIDRDVVQKGVEHKYREIKNIRGQDYLEKIVQLPFTLPPIVDQRFSEFVEKVANRFGSALADPTVRMLLRRASQGNPRRLKRLSNCLNLVLLAAAQIARDRGLEYLDSDDVKRQLALFLMLQVRFPIPFAWLVNHPRTMSEMHPARRDLKAEDKNWTETFRPKLLEWAREVYNEEISQHLADDFIDFWWHAHVVLGIAEPEANRIQELLQITGIVREGELPPTVTPADLGETDAMTVSDDTRNVDATPEASEVDQSRDDAIAGSLENELLSIAKEWEITPLRTLRGRMFGDAGSHQGKAAEIVQRAVIVEDRIDEANLAFDPRSQGELHQARNDLRQVTLESIATDMAAQARLVGMAGFLIVVAALAIFVAPTYLEQSFPTLTALLSSVSSRILATVMIAVGFVTGFVGIRIFVRRPRDRTVTS